MNQLLSLPDEILFKIFIQLDISTLNTLCEFNHFRNKISNFFTIVTDDPTECKVSLSNFPQSCIIHYSDDTQIRDCNSRGLLFVAHDLIGESQLIVTFIKETKFSTFTLMEKLAKLGTFDEFNGTSSEDEMNSKVAKLLVQAANYNKSIQMLFFSFITEAHLENAALNPATLDFPQLKLLKLSDCRSTNGLIKFDFPMIEDICLVGECKSIMNSLDFGKYPKALKIMASDVDLIENITFAELTDLVIVSTGGQGPRESSELSTIRNIELPKLKNIIIRGVSYLINIKSSSDVERFHLSNSVEETTHLQTLHFPYLKFLVINGIHIIGLNSLYAPDCHRLTVNDFEIFDERSHILNQINHLTCYSSRTALERIDSNELVCLEVGQLTKEDLQLITSMDFPKLSKLMIDFGEHNMDDIGCSISFAPMLTDVELLYSTGLGFLRNTWSTLKNLKLELCGSWSLYDATLDNLETFELQVGESSDFVEISNCHFPKLITLAVCSDWFGGQTEGVFENIKAPFLGSIVYEMSVDTLDLTMSCSNLKSVDIQNVSCLVLGKNQSLKEFTSRDNYLTKLVTSKDGGFSQLTEVSVNMETFDNFEHLGEAKSDLEVVYLD